MIHLTNSITTATGFTHYCPWRMSCVRSKHCNINIWCEKQNPEPWRQWIFLRQRGRRAQAFRRERPRRTENRILCRSALTGNGSQPTIGERGGFPPVRRVRLGSGRNGGQQSGESKCGCIFIATIQLRK